MAATLVLPDTWRFSTGGLKIGIGVVNLGVYATGGVAVDPAAFGLTTVYIVTFDGSPAGLSLSWDYTNKKVLAYVPGIAIAAAGAATLDDYALTGVGASTARSIGLDNAATSPVYFGLLKELANTTDLSTMAYNIRMKMEGV